jgi:methionyl-tRNA synthetase
VKALFTKIEDRHIEVFKKKYLPEGSSQSTVSSPQPTVSGKRPKKEDRGQKTEDGRPKTSNEVNAMVDYEEFNRVDLRVGVVKEANDHPNADKLMVLKVDLGELGERTIVAGIKAQYPKELMIGRQIIVVANLQPAKLRGVESQGMLLAATDDNGAPILLQPEKSAKAGAKIK